MAILFVANATMSESFAFAVGGDAIVVDSMPALLRAVEEHPRELLVVIGPDVDLGMALSFTESHRVHRPELGVVLTRRRVDVTILSQAIRAGVREVVNPDDLTALADACRRSLDVSRGVMGATGSAEPTVEGRVVTVFAAKGGCGKTTVATNLAVALAAGGRSRVCLVDLDLAFGDVAIAMQLAPVRTIVDANAMLGSMDPTGVASLLTPHSPGLDTILAPVQPGDAEKIAVPVVAELIRTLRTMFDYVVIDSPPAFTEHVLTAFDLSDTFVLLATLDIPALKNLRLTLDMLDLLGYPRESWQVVLNRSDSKVGLEIADVERSLRAPIAALIPSSRAVSASINKGVPILLDEPNHPVSVAIRRFADDRVRSVREVAPAAPPAAGPAAVPMDPYERHARPRRQRTRQLAFLRRSES
jgi:pilus assembly protein CpaE